MRWAVWQKMTKSAWLVVALGVLGCGGDEAPPAREPAPGPDVGEAAAGVDATPTPTPEPTPAPPPPPEPAPRPSAPADFVGHHVLVRGGATLRTAPRADADEVPLRLGLAEGDRPEPSRAMRVVGEQDGWLQVRAPAPAERCGDGLAALAIFDVALWVEPTQVAPALARAFETDFGDGTRVELRPGAAVSEAGAAKATVDVGGITFALEIPETEIGTIYDPDPNEANTGQSQSLALGKSLRVDGQDLSPLSSLFGTAMQPWVDATRQVEGTTFVRVANRCATFVAHVVEEAPEPDPEAARTAALRRATAFGVIGTIGGTTGFGETFEIAKDAKVYWPDGTEAGTARRAHTFETYAKTKDRKGRRCFTTELDPSAPGARLELCFGRKDVTVHESPFAASALGSTALLGTLGSPLPSGSAFGSLYGESLGGLSGFGEGGGGTREMGGLGSLGSGGGDGGRGYGTLGTGTPHSSSKMTLKVVDVTGGLDSKEVYRVVKRQANTLRYCYESALATDGTLAGEAHLRATIGTSGEVTSVSESGLADVAPCMARKIRRAKFPTASAITVVTIDIELSQP